MNKEKPLVEALIHFVKAAPVSLHVPGHKNGLVSGLPNLLKEALKYDVTELTGLDDYHHPEEAIQEAQQLLTNIYKADRSFFLVNGSTVGNLAMIYATCQFGDTIIVQRNAHKSIFHAIELIGANPVFVAPEWDVHTKTAGAVSTRTLKDALERFPKAKAVALTYPTYYGVASKELQEQITLCHGLNIPVLIDEAHGAHFITSNNFPESALNLGADVVVQSAHKTLPAMTMASFLHVKSNLVDVARVNHYLRMLQSSSPSYLLMASLDDARHYVATYKESDYVYLKEKREYFIEALKLIKGLEVIEVDDTLKLLLRVPGYTGFEMKVMLEASGVFVELADREQVLLVLPLLKQGVTYPFANIKVRIKEAVTNLRKKPKGNNMLASLDFDGQKVSMPSVNFQGVQSAQKEWISYTKGLGRIAAEMIIPYPPGVPLFVIGEKITVAKLAYLTELHSIGADFQGNHQLEQNLICVIKQ